MFMATNNISLDSQFHLFTPPKHSELPNSEQKILSKIYQGFREYYLLQKKKLDWEQDVSSWSEGFTNKQGKLNRLGYYGIQEG
jgi:hypothetical protein